MPSLLTNFEYDIFISYRHNDNRSGWVTEFVNALQEELAATIKEPLTIYFDKNPHDGLLETHNVDKSLEGKLKCLIFIPIISQTYCDPKSFAWQHEFVAFNKLAKEDQFGRDIKLSNGNVASRILPIKIHDLDVEDKALFENEIGSVLRAIEFIYKEAGVNRPLKSTDSKGENQNKTDYPNQVNKVANAIKKIITALKNPIAKRPTPNLPTGLAGAQPAYAEASTGRPSTTSPKNKKILIASFALLLLIIITYFFYQQRSKNNQQPIQLDKSVAVLPFADMSPAQDQEYLSDGIAEDIITALSKIQNLKVIGRTSSFQFKGQKIDLRDIGSKLNVATVLEGSVMKSGNKIRITAQLINVKDGTHIWSERYEKPMDDIFAIQDEIARMISNKMKVTMLGKSEGVRIPTMNMEAYNLYLRGNFEIQKVTPESMETGLEMMKRAIQLDPDFALPYLGIAFYNAAATDFYLAPDVAMPQVREASLTALKKDSTIADAHAWYGFYSYWYSWDWVESQKQFIKAIQLDPNKTLSHWIYSWQLSSQGDFDKSLQESARTVELEPMDALIGSHHALMYYYARDYDKAIKQLDKVRAFETRQPFEHFIRGQCYSVVGKFEEAIAEQKLAHELFSAPWSHARLAYAYAIAGDKQNALSILESLKKESTTRYVASDVVASVYVALHDNDRAFEYLEKAVNERAAWMVWIKVDPIWDPIRKDARYAAILKKMKLDK